MAREQDYHTIMCGLQELDLQMNAVPSDLVLIGERAFPLVMNPRGQVLMAASYYGRGHRKGVIGILPSRKGAHRVLSKSGLDCQLTGLRKDLSIYVCTSYSDAQCAEIQEFVAEGGGLMIGGHAWHWAQTHRGRNVMTDYPGNHILNKMGLSLLGSTLKGGLYKAPETDQSYKKGYHFRNMLHRFAEHVYLGQELTNHEQSYLKQLGNDCASYLQMQCYGSTAYTSMLVGFFDIVKKFGFPQVSSNSPVESAKDRLMLHIGSEVYKVSPDPDALLSYIIKDRPKFCSEEWISTGLYLSPGMKTNIAVPPEIIRKNWQVMNKVYTYNIGRAEVLKRAPVVHERFPLDAEMVQVCNLWGGLIYIIAPPQSKVDGVEIVVQDAVQAPYFKSGETSVADWVDRIRQAPAPWAELEFENIIMTLQSEFIRNLDRPDKVAKLWDTIMRSIADLAAKPNKFPRKERFVADVQISAGFMHAGYPIMMQTVSAPELVNVQEAYKKGLWGQIHELGHNQQCRVWEFPPHTTECTCNLWSVYVHEKVLGLNRFKVHPGLTPKNARLISNHIAMAPLKVFLSMDFAQYLGAFRLLAEKSMVQHLVYTCTRVYCHLQTLSVAAVILQEKFGWDAFKKVFNIYHDMSGVPDNNAEKMNLYAETFSNVVKMNLCPFFKAWGWPIQPDTQKKISHLPAWSDHPMVQYA
ncbi:hypothetical protein H4Q32_029351 [Labeo rohita]|uniref:Peptidase M60 domain-containing protein n=1 Tax=Labeo rohita TaxID=84645 RepID=A0ABQ8MW03_LABRO|nr:hypothetical protein H4Q32_029351 [Labeo rohita]